MNERSDGVWNFGSALWNVVKNVTIFGVLGPPLGALTWMLPMLVYLMATDGSVPLDRALSNSVMMLMAGVMFSYFFGALPAVLAGAMVGLGELLFRSFGFFHAVVAGLVVAFLLFWRSDLLTFMRSGKAQPALLERIDGASLGSIALTIAVFGTICVVPTSSAGRSVVLSRSKNSRFISC